MDPDVIPEMRVDIAKTPNLWVPAWNAISLIMPHNDPYLQKSVVNDTSLGVLLYYESIFLNELGKW